MAKRGQPCDCCGGKRLRKHRLCDACFAALPSYLRNPLLETWRRRDKPAWRAARTAARQHVAVIRAPRVAPSEAYRNTARLLGERD